MKWLHWDHFEIALLRTKTYNIILTFSTLASDLKLLTIQGATLKVDKANFLTDFERKTKDIEGLRAKKTVTAFAKNEKIIFIKGVIIPSKIINRLGSIINYYAE